MSNETERGLMPPSERGKSAIQIKCMPVAESGSLNILTGEPPLPSSIGTNFASASNLSDCSPEARKFLKLLGGGIRLWQQAGRWLAICINKRPGIRLEILNAAPFLNRKMLDNFERVGRGELLPNLLLEEHRPGVKRMMLLTAKEQAVLESQQIAFWNGAKVERRFVRDLKSIEVAKVFDGIKIRSIAEQKQYDFDLAKKRKGRRWEILGRRIYLRGGFFTARELQQMLDDLAKPVAK